MKKAVSFNDRPPCLPFVFGLVVLFGLIVLLAGCVTVKDYRGPINKQKLVADYVQLGKAYLQRNSRELARRNFDKALAVDSRSAQANNGMALLYQLNGEWALAEAHYLKAIDADADYTQVKDNYGLFLYRQGRYREAYNILHEVTVDLSYERRAQALANLGRTALKLGKRERAKSLFQHALNINSKVLISIIELAEMHFDEEDYAKSKHYLDQYVQLAPRHSPRSLWLGIRIERIFGNKDKEASYVLALKNLHPYSNEYLQYQATSGNDRQ